MYYMCFCGRKNEVLIHRGKRFIWPCPKCLSSGGTPFYEDGDELRTGNEDFKWVADKRGRLEVYCAHCNIPAHTETVCGSGPCVGGIGSPLGTEGWECKKCGVRYEFKTA